MPSHSPWTRERTVFLVLSLALAALPFAVVTFPPSVDLAQQAAQIRLLDEQLGLAPETTPADRYEVRWWAPNNLVYVVFFTAARIFVPFTAARVALGLVGLVMVFAIHELARRRARPPEHAMLAGTLVFSVSLYWGFIGFFLGAAVFLLCLDRALRPPDALHPLRELVELSALATVVYAAHSLWLPVMVLALLGAPLAQRVPLRQALPRVLALVPALVHSLIWFPRLHSERAGAGFDLAAHWRPLELRLARLLDGDALYGGLQGTFEAGMAALLVLWMIVGMATPARSARGGADRALLVLAGALFAFVLIAPDKYMNTIEFGARFGPVAGILALLSVPRLPLRPLLARAIPVVSCSMFAATTTAGWIAVDRSELAGLQECVSVVPGPARVLGLDFVHRSEILDGVPYLQMFAWRQASYGGEVSFSFAEHRSGIIGFRDTRPRPWTGGLEWDAERVTSADLEHFDLVIVVGSERQHARFAETAEVVPLTETGRFRLYRTNP